MKNMSSSHKDRMNILLPNTLLFDEDKSDNNEEPNKALTLEETMVDIESEIEQ